MTLTHPTNEISYTELDYVLGEIASRWRVPGMAVGIVDGGQIAYTRGFGVQSLVVSHADMDG